jgi:hypothetical protein
MTAEAAAHANEPVPSAAERKVGLPRAVDGVFQKAMAKRPQDRYRSAGELVTALRNAFEEPEMSTVVLPPPADVRPISEERPPRRWPYAVVLLLLGGLAGGILAFVLTSDGDHKRASPQVRTVVKTVQGKVRTVTQQVTTPAPPPPAAPPPAAPPPASQSGASLNEAGFAKMQAGDYQGALPLLEQAVARLQGTDSLAEAYADFNLASTRLRLGRCDGVKDLLKNSRRIQGNRSEIDAALAQEKAQCHGGGNAEGD